MLTSILDIVGITLTGTKDINSYFDKIYVISLKEDTHQRKLITEYLHKFNIRFEFFDAIDGYKSKEIISYYEDYLSWSFNDPRTHHVEKLYQKKLIKSPGALGLLETYKNLFEYVLDQDKIGTILVLEDDVLIDKQLHKKFAEIQNHIKNFDLLYFGASHHLWNSHNIIKVSDGTNYYKAPRILDGSFAVAYKRKIFKKLLEKILQKNAPIDLILRDIISCDNSYVIYPNVMIAETTRPSRTSFQSRNLRYHSERVKWKLDDIDYTRGILKTSIIIATYNNDTTIKHCIESALSQTYKNTEVIVVDDCSTDGTDDIIKSFGDKVKSIKLTQNVGAYKARNIGLEKATGFFVCILDADDIMMTKKIEIDIHNYYNQKNCEIFLSNIYRSKNIANIQNINDNSLQKLIDDERRPYMKLKNIPWGYRYRVGMQTFFVEKAFFSKYGRWLEDFRYGMDIELIQRYIVKKYGIFIDHRSLFREMCMNNCKKYGIHISDTMNYFSYPLNDNNATNLCKGYDRETIHDVTNKKLIDMLNQ